LEKLVYACNRTLLVVHTDYATSEGPGLPSDHEYSYSYL
jgi:hypothetical protein